MNTPNTSNLRVLMRVSYSENNRYGTYALTARNHLCYCMAHNYTYMAVNEPYSMYNNLEEISGLLRRYDVVFTCDSDIFITNQNIPVTSFALNYLSAATECWGPDIRTIFNGGLLVFYKKDDGIFEYLKSLSKFQDVCKKSKKTKGYFKFVFKLKNKNISAVCTMPTYPMFGTQSVLNFAYLLDKKDLVSGMSLILPGQLQSYLPEYVPHCYKHMYEDALWNKNKFSLHLLGQRPNSVFKSKLDMMNDFISKHPEYK